eukprot:Skav233854  [mRNA]  locus=scaffold2551:141782:143090:+ [translate_table: standard]
MPVLGQGKFSDPASLRATFPFRDENAYTRVITLRGRTGAVLGLEPAPGEHGEHIAACLVQALPAAGLLQVRHVATDSPGHKLLQDLRQCCPNLEALSLDPTHTAMRYEQATGGHKTAGSVLVRRFMMKFTSFDASIRSNIWGPFFDGSAPVACSLQEETLRKHILNSSLAKARARRVIDASLNLKTWPTRLQFVEAMAAVSAVHVNEMGKKIDGGQVTVAKMLHSVTSAEKAEWLLNNLRYRQFLSAPVRGLLPSGTTSNEALHAEINSWSVLAGRFGKPLWTKKEWAAWVQKDLDLPIVQARRSEQRTVAAAGGARKRPACEPKRKPKRKRTAFTLDRATAFRRTGVHGRRNSIEAE